MSAEYVIIVAIVLIIASALWVSRHKNSILRDNYDVHPGTTKPEDEER